jgi:hypothetical protein
MSALMFSERSREERGVPCASSRVVVRSTTAYTTVTVSQLIHQPPRCAATAHLPLGGGASQK